MASNDKTLISLTNLSTFKDASVPDVLMAWLVFNPNVSDYDAYPQYLIDGMYDNCSITVYINPHGVDPYFGLSYNISSLHQVYLNYFTDFNFDDDRLLYYRPQCLITLFHELYTYNVDDRGLTFSNMELHYVRDGETMLTAITGNEFSVMQTIYGVCKSASEESENSGIMLIPCQEGWLIYCVEYGAFRFVGRNKIAYMIRAGRDNINDFIDGEITDLQSMTEGLKEGDLIPYCYITQRGTSDV